MPGKNINVNHLKCNRKEEWRQVVGLERCYLISNRGRVMRIGGGPGSRDGRILKMQNSHGYHRVTLQSSGEQYYRFVHRLVAAAFIGPIPSRKHEINHKDGCKTNNTPSNLEYVTHRENEDHAARLGLKARGERNTKSKLTVYKVIELRRLASEGWSIGDLGKRYGIYPSSAYMVIKRRNWKHIP